MYNIVVVTANRAEYGLLYPLLKEIENDTELNLRLVVTGTHLSEKYGFTKNEIIRDGFSIDEEIPILTDGNSKYDISLIISNAIIGFAKYFKNKNIDMLILFGDRTEMLGVAIAALNENIPIGHISGGSVTEGAVDDSIRHCLTKLSYLHFTTTELYRKRVIQLGEEPNRVINSGSLAVDNILRFPLLNEKEIRSILGVREKIKYAVVTFHPITRDNDSGISQVLELIEAMKEEKNVFFLVTGSNADTGGETTIRLLKEFCKTKNARFIDSLGKTQYLSAVKYASFVMGNSSSGLTEAPILGTPSINIGDRQQGRITPDTVINVASDYCKIKSAIEIALVMKRKKTGIYGDGHAASIIVNKIKHSLAKEINIKKKFYDIEF